MLFVARTPAQGHRATGGSTLTYSWLSYCMNQPWTVKKGRTVQEWPNDGQLAKPGGGDCGAPRASIETAGAHAVDVCVQIACFVRPSIAC